MMFLGNILYDDPQELSQLLLNAVNEGSATLENFSLRRGKDRT